MAGTPSRTSERARQKSFQARGAGPPAAPAFPDVGAKRREPGPEGAARLFGTAEDAEVRVRERAGEPGPDRPLVGGEVAVALRRPRQAPVARVGGGERA